MNIGSFPHPLPAHSRTVTVPVVTPKPITAERVPQNPFMAPNGRSNMHNDAYMSDTYNWAGPNGGVVEIRYSPMLGECPTLTFNAQGQIISLYIGLSKGGNKSDATRELCMIDPETLGVLTTYTLPSGGGGSTNFGGGGYFYLNHLGQAVVPTADQQVLIVDIINDPPAFSLNRSFPLGSVIGDANASLQSALPDWSGRIWWVTDTGAVGYTDPDSGLSRAITLPSQKIGNSFSIDETGGVFIVSDCAMYRFDVAASGEDPQCTWSCTYDRGSLTKPGQQNFGSGTTPTLVGASYCGITDNADPQMHVVVYRRERDFDGDRKVCEVPVFKASESDTENSLIGYTGTYFVENNYGYTGSVAQETGPVTPGMAKVRFDGPVRSGCVAWENDAVVIPSVVSKLSLADGLLYTYTLEIDEHGRRNWFITTIDSETGNVVYKVFAGSGQAYDNHYASLYIGPDGTVYVPLQAGIVSLRQAQREKR